MVKMPESRPYVKGQKEINESVNISIFKKILVLLYKYLI